MYNHYLFQLTSTWKVKNMCKHVKKIKDQL